MKKEKKEKKGKKDKKEPKKKINTSAKASTFGASLKILSLSPRGSPSPRSKKAPTSPTTLSPLSKKTSDTTEKSKFPQFCATSRPRADKAGGDEVDGIRVYGMGGYQEETYCTSYPPHPTTREKKSRSLGTIVKLKKKTAEKQAHNMRKVAQTSLLRMKSPTMKTIMTNHVLQMNAINT